MKTFVKTEKSFDFDFLRKGRILIKIYLNKKFTFWTGLSSEKAVF